MKKISLLLGMFFIAITSLTAQIVVDAEMFKSNPNAFMGKVVTIKNVTFKGSNITPGLPTGIVSSPSGNVGTSTPSPVGIAGPTSGPAKSLHCNPQPNFTLTKWSLGPQNDICLQSDAKIKPMLDMCETGKVVKSISFRVTPTVYMVTRIEP